MKTIAICNHKGGVGKTALSMAIAEGLHRKGKRTLLVDLDQQMNATQQAKLMPGSKCIGHQNCLGLLE